MDFNIYNEWKSKRFSNMHSPVIYIILEIKKEMNSSKSSYSQYLAYIKNLYIQYIHICVIKSRLYLGRGINNIVDPLDGYREEEWKSNYSIEERGRILILLLETQIQEWRWAYICSGSTCN